VYVCVCTRSCESGANLCMHAMRTCVKEEIKVTWHHNLSLEEDTCEEEDTWMRTHLKEEIKVTWYHNLS
jgi:hypothetical protein